MSITKENFLFKDRLVKGVTKDGHFKISVVKTTTLVNEARDRHGLSLLATVILGKTLTAAALLASELKKKNVFKFDSMATVRFNMWLQKLIV